MARMSSQQLAAHFLRNGIGLNDPIPEGPHAGKTVRQLIEERQRQEQEYQGAFGGGQTLDELLQQALQSPDPKSYRVPYGQFQGMGVEQLVAAKKQQQEYLRDAGLLPREPEGPGWQDYAMALGMPVAQALALDYGRGLMNGSNATAQPTAGASGGGGGSSAMSSVGTGTGAASTAYGGYQLANQAMSQGIAQGGAQLGAQAGAQGATYGAGAASGGGQVAGQVGAQAGAQSGSTLGSTAASLAPWLGLAGMSYYYGDQIYDAYKQMGEAETSGAGSLKAGLLSTGPFLGWAAPIVDYLGIKTGKDKEQLERDNMRDYFRENTQLYNPEVESQIGLAGGNFWDTREMEASRNIDWDNVNHEVVGQLDPLMYALLGPEVGDKKGWMVGEFYNAATKGGGDAKANVKQMYQNAGKDRDAIYQQIASDTTLDEGTKKAWLAAIDAVFGVQNPNAPKAEAKAPEAPGVQSQVAEAALLPAMKDPLVSPNRVEPKKQQQAQTDPLLAAIATPQQQAINSQLAMAAQQKPKAGSYRSSRFWGG